jgi:radical SAM protein with 4Fe4S-binding SPASM domain
MKIQKDIPFNLFQKIVQEMEEIGVFEIILGGGEPLMHPQFSQMLQYLSGRRLFPAITTNGYFVNTRFIEMLESIEFRGSIQVSLHGKTPETHNRIVNHPRGYDRAVKAIKQLIAHRFNVSVATISSVLNYEEIPQLLKDLEDLGITSFNIIFVLPVGRATRDLVLRPDQYEELLEYIQHMKTRHTVFTDYNLWFELQDAPRNPLFQYYCTCGVVHATVDPEGNVFPCSLLKFPQFRLGTCQTRSLKDIFDHPEKEVIADIYGVSPPECSGCQFEKVCKGGCRAVALAYHGKPLARDIRCHKEVSL